MGLVWLTSKTLESHIRPSSMMRLYKEGVINCQPWWWTRSTWGTFFLREFTMKTKFRSSGKMKECSISWTSRWWVSSWPGCTSTSSWWNCLTIDCCVRTRRPSSARSSLTRSSTNTLWRKWMSSGAPLLAAVCLKSLNSRRNRRMTLAPVLTIPTRALRTLSHVKGPSISSWLKSLRRV